MIKGKTNHPKAKVVSGTLALHRHFHESMLKVSRAADLKGMKSCRKQEESVHPCACPSVLPSAFDGPGIGFEAAKLSIG